MSNDLVDNLLNFSIATTPGGIEKQEAQGQQNLINSTALPIKGDWNVLARWGIVKGEPINNLFCHCTLPDGWQKVATDHSMWSKLVDDRGLNRANVFYKAAFYDTAAHFNTVKRFSVGTFYSHEDNPTYGKQFKVVDNGLDRSVFVDAPVYAGEYNGKLVAAQAGKVYAFQEDALKLMTHWQVSTVSLLARNEFTSKWHNEKVQQYDFIDAVEELALVNCDQYLSQLPTDDSVWDSRFDFSDIA